MFFSSACSRFMSVAASCVSQLPLALGQRRRPRRAEQCSAIKNPLPQPSSRVARSAVQSEHRAGEFEFGRVGRVQRADPARSDSGLYCAMSAVAGLAASSALRVLRCGGENGMREAFAAKNKLSRNVVNPRREVDFATVCKDKACRSASEKAHQGRRPGE